jgi:peptidoglycan/LPS O-acetylase OafA/YrhL
VYLHFVWLTHRFSIRLTLFREILWGIILARLSWQYFESPILALKRRFTYSLKAPQLAAMALAGIARTIEPRPAGQAGQAASQ